MSAQTCAHCGNVTAESTEFCATCGEPLGAPGGEESAVANVDGSAGPVTPKLAVFKRRWFWPVVAVVTFIVGLGIGMISTAGTSPGDLKTIQDSQAQVATLQSRATEADAKVTSLESRATEADSLAASLKTSITSLESQVEKLTKERDELKVELDPIRRAEAAAAKEAADKVAAETAAKAAADKAAADTAAKAAAEQAANTFTDGVYLVGEDIKPGTYRGVLTGSMEFGYWARLSGTDGTLGSIIANGTPQGPFVLTIKSSDVAVELSGVKLTLK
jgi:hypothetical protein